MTRPAALEGITPVKFVSPFYATARRYIGISAVTVDAWLRAKATARIEGDMVTLEDSAGRLHIGSFLFTHRGRIAKWVDQFNARSASQIAA